MSPLHAPWDTYTYILDHLEPIITSLDQALADGHHGGCGLPPATLLLLRLIRTSLSNKKRGEVALIALYSCSGLIKLGGLAVSLCDYLLQSVRQPSDQTISLVSDMLVLALELVGILLEALVEARGEEFRDRSIIKSLFKAYTVTVVCSAISNKKEKVCASLTKTPKTDFPIDIFFITPPHRP